MRVRDLGLAGFALAALAAGGVACADDKPITERGKTIESAVATPVEDLNIKKVKIPDVLLRAQANPYDLSTTPTCDALAHEVSLLNSELGDDHDDKVMDPAPEEPQGKGPAATALLKAGVAQAIPFRGIIRQVTGAAAHDEAVNKAIDAGFARRGFLKGRALEMNCAAGAAPAWFTPRPEKETEAQKTATPAPAEAPPPEAMTTAAMEPAPAVRPVIEAAPLPRLPGAMDADVVLAEPMAPPAPAQIPEPGTLDAQLAGQPAGAEPF